MYLRVGRIWFIAVSSIETMPNRHLNYWQKYPQYTARAAAIGRATNTVQARTLKPVMVICILALSFTRGKGVEGTGRSRNLHSGDQPSFTSKTWKGRTCFYQEIREA